MDEAKSISPIYHMNTDLYYKTEFCFWWMKYITFLLWDICSRLYMVSSIRSDSKQRNYSKSISITFTGLWLHAYPFRSRKYHIVRYFIPPMGIPLSSLLGTSGYWHLSQNKWVFFQILESAICYLANISREDGEPIPQFKDTKPLNTVRKTALDMFH